jgi:hypothetical protein
VLIVTLVVSVGVALLMLVVVARKAAPDDAVVEQLQELPEIARVKGGSQ